MRNGDSIRFVYGDAANPFLNGIELIAIRDGSVIATQEVVIVRGSPLDDQLNRNDTITFYFVSGSFIVQPSNTWTV